MIYFNNVHDIIFIIKIFIMYIILNLKEIVAGSMGCRSDFLLWEGY